MPYLLSLSDAAGNVVASRHVPVTGDDRAMEMKLIQYRAGELYRAARSGYSPLFAARQAPQVKTYTVRFQVRTGLLVALCALGALALLAYGLSLH